MRSSPGFQKLAERFDPYIEELHTFFDSCDVVFGSPQDVLPFAERLSVPGYLRDGICAMIRAVIYREQEGISHLELLDLILVAVGGPDVEEDAPELQESERRLSRVIGQAMTSLWSMPDGASSTPVFSNESLADTSATPHVEPVPVPLPPPDVFTAAVPVTELRGSLPAMRSFGAAVMPFFVELPSEVVPRKTETPAPVAVAASSAIGDLRNHPAAAPEVPAGSASVTPRPAMWASPPPWLWAAGLCALLIAPGVSLLRPRRAVQAKPPSRAVVRHAVPAAIPLPTPGPDTWSLSNRQTLAATAPAESLDSLPADPPATRPHTRRATPLSTRPNSRPVAPSNPLSQPPAQVPSWSASDGASRETDMPGPDRSLPPTAFHAPYSSASPTSTPEAPDVPPPSPDA